MLKGKKASPVEFSGGLNDSVGKTCNYSLLIALNSSTRGSHALGVLVTLVSVGDMYDCTLCMDSRIFLCILYVR